ncbi:hypothetical protein PGUG_04471 [Meyerozyma guilliermondii ATCC 6260]|uniref:Palmitoyltransferase n=1 Tax=Meyerozyma guilliermondii (strain ATCC 6260 / CBS 566 / DSM 6381 / JCM 1539 / NBRC 10279 / NRRL Y-324) TaxID=294746 RepID=A5DMH0_PICGU|nr:uncharacterized protein PGUG_04471 [Meyerozyma guilliermondii ATCC 6260]EDK40373.2 hypothetical protein PGUG_04471 [Meyerozyma guilliermondii ATCC 6260]
MQSHRGPRHAHARTSHKPVIGTAAQSIAMAPWYYRVLRSWLVMDPSIMVEDDDVRRNYQISKHAGLKFIYFFGGRARTVKQAPIAAICGILIFIPGILFFVFEANWMWHNHHRAVVIVFAYFWGLCGSCFIKAATSDPGVVPRNIHIPSSLTKIEVSETGPRLEPSFAPSEYFNVISLPHKTSSAGVKVRYCSTCHIWRPPRCSHCSVCNSCVLHHDHHCLYLNNCVGLRNYRYFLWFLLSAVIASALILYTSLHHLLSTSYRKTPLSVVLVIYCGLGVLYPLLLLCFHTYISMWNITTREFLNYVRGSSLKHSENFIYSYNGGLLRNMFLNWVARPRMWSIQGIREHYAPSDIRQKAVQQLRSFESEK